MDYSINSSSDPECKKQEKQDTAVTDAIGVLIEKSTWEIFLKYRNELLAEDITYIVPAVCGAERNSELTPLQEEIHGLITPNIQEIFRKLEIHETMDDHSFAVRYIVRSMIITKIIFIIESFRNKFQTHNLNERSKMMLLKELAPYGHA